MAIIRNQAFNNPRDAVRFQSPSVGGNGGVGLRIDGMIGGGGWINVSATNVQEICRRRKERPNYTLSLCMPCSKGREKTAKI